MTFPDHYLLSWGGTFVSDPTEIWNNNLRLAQDDNVDLAAFPAMTHAEQDAYLALAVPVIKTHMGNVDSGYPSNVQLRWVKFNRIGPNGEYHSPSESHTAFQVSPYTTGGSTSPFPVTTACVVTHLSSVERGPGSRGRVFVPQPNFALSTTTYRIASTKTAQVATAWRTFYLAISGLMTGPNALVPSIVSSVGNPGPARTINQTQVGDIVDYMGSRRNRLVESRSTSATFN